MKRFNLSKVLIALGLLVMPITSCGCSGEVEPTKESPSPTPSEKDYSNDERYAIYLLAKADGYTGSYEEWLESIKGKDGKDGVDGKTPYIGENGNWWIGDSDTGVKASGENGKDGTNGSDGANGQTPYIGENGNWWIGDTDTGVKAKGEDGKDGKDADRHEGTEGLEFYPLDDGTYAVGAGRASQLSHIVIPSTYNEKPVTKIVDFGFGKREHTIYIDENNESYNHSKLQSIEIPDSIVEIGNNAFDYCTLLKEIKIPDSVTKIGLDAFQYCKSLEKVIIPANVTYIGSYSFRFCEKLSFIYIPESVEFVGKESFDNDTNLKICIEASVAPDGWHKEWNYNDYYNSDANPYFTSVKTFETPNGTIYASVVNNEAVVHKYIGVDKELVIPDELIFNGVSYQVTALSNKAFANTDLEIVTIPTGVNSIGEHVFDNCSSLERINYLGTKNDWDTKIGIGFNGDFSIALVYCSDGKLTEFTGENEVIEVTITSLPYWIRNDDCVLFAQYYTNQEKFVRISYPDEETYSYATFSIDTNAVAFRLIRCISGTETPDFEAGQHAENCIYNITGYIKLVTGVIEYDASNWSGYNNH